MATTIANLNIRIGATTNGLAAGVQQATGMINSLQSKIAGIATQVAAAAGGLSLAGFVGMGAKLATDVEKSAAAFEVFTGSAEKAQEVMSGLRAQALENPLYSFQQFTDTARGLLAAGSEVDQVQEQVRILADVAAGSAQPLNELAMVFAQVQNAGRLTGGELRQFNERTVPLLRNLAEMLGVDTMKIREMTEAGQISAEMVTLAFRRMVAAGGDFDGMTEKMAATTWGRWAKLTESVSALAEKFGTALMPAMNNIIDVGQRVVDWLNGMDTATLRAVAKWGAYTLAVGAAIAIAPRLIGTMTAIVQAIRAMATAQALLAAVSGPTGWLTLIGAGVMAGGAVLGISAAFDGVSKSLDKATKSAKQYGETKDDIDKQARAIQAANDAARAAEEQQKKLEAYGNQLTQSLRTPWEVMRDEVAKTQEAVNAGVISAETYNRAIQKIADTYASAAMSKMELEKPAGTAAVTRFTQQGFSAAATGERLSRHMERMVKLQADLLGEVKALVAKEPLRVKRVSL